MNPSDARDVVTKYVNESHLTFRMGLDQGGKVTEAYGVQAFPTNYLVGADGASCAGPPRHPTFCLTWARTPMPLSGRCRSPTRPRW